MARQHHDSVKFITEFAKQTEVTDDDALVIPEDLTTLSDEDLTALQDKATETFDSLYGDGTNFTDEDLTMLSDLTDSLKTLAAEATKRETAATARAEKAAALAAQVRPENTLSADTAVAEETDEETDEDSEEPTDEDVSENTDAAETITASARRVNLSKMQARAAKRPKPRQKVDADDPSARLKSILRLADSDEGTDFRGLSEVIDRRLGSFNLAQYQRAAANGKAMTEQKALAKVHRTFSPDLTIQSSDPEHIAEVLRRATSQDRLAGNSLLASGGWGAPSETVYDIMSELESTDGLLSIPEISVRRGGLRYTVGPDFSTLYTDITGFHYTEAQDTAGTYAVDANGVGTGAAGTKPFYKIPTPSFTDARLDTDGIGLQAGLLAARGFPEAIARVTRGAMTVRAHRTDTRLIDAMIAGSTAVTMTAAQAGATAPLLDAIEKQVEHFKYAHRLARGTVLEAVFPFWVLGVVRSDLARRLGVENMLSVSDSMIVGWFRDRGIAPQFVYNYQPITGLATAFLNWPATVEFLLYTAGCWVKGTDDVISIDTLYDSTLLGDNDFTALFLEDAWFMAKMHHESRRVTVALTPDGAVHAGVDIAADGTIAI